MCGLMPVIGKFDKEQRTLASLVDPDDPELFFGKVAAASFGSGPASPAFADAHGTRDSEPVERNQVRNAAELLPSVDRAVNAVLRKRRRSKDFAEDFRGWVMLKMLERDGARLKRFRGESTFLTYLRVVVDRLYCDYLISRNGKWHPSKRASKLGTRALELEKLVYRDGFTLDEAVATMGVRDGSGVETDLRACFAEIRPRHPRCFVGLEWVSELRADDRFSADAILRERELQGAVTRVRDSLASALAELPEEDRRILELHFARGLRISRIGHLLGLRQSSTYRRMHRILRVLRRKLEARGVSPDGLLPAMPGIEGVLTRENSGRRDLGDPAHDGRRKNRGAVRLGERGGRRFDRERLVEETAVGF